MARFSVSMVALLLVASLARGEQWLLDRTVRVVHVVKRTGGSSEFSGSGTVVAKTDAVFFVLTCAHNLTNNGKLAEGKVSVVLSSGKNVPAKVVHADIGADMALLAVASKANVTPALFARTEQYRAGTKITKCGYPLTKRVIGSGKILDVVAHREVGGKRLSIAVSDIKTTFGDSGCGVFRARDKRLIGMIYGGRGGESSMLRITDLVRFLEECAEKDRSFKFDSEGR